MPPPDVHNQVSTFLGEGNTEKLAVDTNKAWKWEGALLNIIHQLPRTIQDATSLVSKLAKRYLWVDSLCIVQDDKNHKRVQIAAMNKISNSAALAVLVRQVITPIVAFLE